MPGVLVDSNVLLDVITDDPNWGGWSRSTLRHIADGSILVINPMIYAEVAAGFSSIEALDEALPYELYRRDEVPYEAAFLASKVYLEYLRRGGTRRSPLPDFFIGAHAAIAGYQVLTRDATRYRTYFPGLDVIAPA